MLALKPWLGLPETVIVWLVATVGNPSRISFVAAADNPQFATLNENRIPDIGILLRDGSGWPAVMLPFEAVLAPAMLITGNSCKLGIPTTIPFMFVMPAVEPGNGGMRFALVLEYIRLAVVSAAIETGNGGKSSALKQLANIADVFVTFAALPKNTGKSLKPLDW